MWPSTGKKDNHLSVIKLITTNFIKINQTEEKKSVKVLHFLNIFLCKKWQIFKSNQVSTLWALMKVPFCV